MGFWVAFAAPDVFAAFFDGVYAVKMFWLFLAVCPL